MRREGLYSSHLTEWRRARERGELDALSPKKRGRKAKEAHPLEKKVTELQRSLEKAELRAKRAEALVELSRYVVGWLIADAESSALAEKLMAESCERQGIKPGQLTIHADRGSSHRPCRRRRGSISPSRWTGA